MWSSVSDDGSEEPLERFRVTRENEGVEDERREEIRAENRNLSPSPPLSPCGPAVVSSVCRLAANTKHSTFPFTLRPPARALSVIISLSLRNTSCTDAVLIFSMFKFS